MLSDKESNAMETQKTQVRSMVKIPWKRNGNPFQYSCPENFMDKEPGELQLSDHKESDTIQQLSMEHS